MIKTQLVPEQEEAVQWMLRQPRFIIADSVGFGKTLAALAALDRIREQIDAKLLVLANKNAVGNWIEQVNEHTDMSIVTGGSVGSENTTRRVLRDDPDVTVLTYPSMASKYTELIVEMYKRRPKGMILALEEAHYVRNPTSARHKFVEKVMRCSPVGWLITATPINNRIEDIYDIMNLAIPNFFGAKHYFMDKYTVREFDDIWNPKLGRTIKRAKVVGYKHLDELMEKVSPYIARRVRKVPVKFEAVMTTQCPEEEALYLTAAEGMIGFDYEDEEQAVRDFGARMPDLQRVVDGAADIDREIREGPLSSKEQAMVDGLVESFKTENKAAVVFCFYQMTFERLRKVLNEYQSKIGFKKLWTLSREQDSPEERHEIASGFDHGDVLLMTSVGKEAMNLRHCDEMWMYNIPDSAQDVTQVVGRITRRDSVYSSFMVKVPVVDNTIDKYKVAKLLSRSAVIEAVIGGDAALPEGRLITPEDLRDMRKELLWRVKKRR